MDCLNASVDAIRAMGENKKTNSHIGKISAIQGDYAAMAAKQAYLDNAPGKRKSKNQE